MITNCVDTTQFANDQSSQIVAYCHNNELDEVKYEEYVVK